MPGWRPSTTGRAPGGTAAARSRWRRAGRRRGRAAPLPAGRRARHRPCPGPAGQALTRREQRSPVVLLPAVNGLGLAVIAPARPAGAAVVVGISPPAVPGWTAAGGVGPP